MGQERRKRRSEQSTERAELKKSGRTNDRRVDRPWIVTEGRVAEAKQASSNLRLPGARILLLLFSLSLVRRAERDFDLDLADLPIRKAAKGKKAKAKAPVV